MSVELDEVARFTGGWIRVCERRLLPVPVGMIVLAERRSGLLVPEVGYGADGLTLAQPVFLAPSPHADLTLTPQWRQERGLRGLAEGHLSLSEGEGSQLRGVLGYDTLTQSWRGAGDLEHACIPGVRIESNTFQFADSTLQRPIAGVLAGTLAHGGLVASGEARVDGFADGEDALALTDARLRSMGTGSLVGTHHTNTLNLSSSLSVRGVSWQSADPWVVGTAQAQALVPMWGDVRGMRHLARIGVAGSVSDVSAQAEVRSPDEVLPDVVSVGPLLTSRWLAPSGVPLSAEIALPWTPDGWKPTADARLNLMAWSGRVQLRPELVHGSFGWSADPGRISAALIHTDAITQGSLSTSWWVPGLPLSLGWRHLMDLTALERLSAGPAAGYRSPCDCLDVQLGASFSVDRTVPDLSLQVRIR